MVCAALLVLIKVWLMVFPEPFAAPVTLLFEPTVQVNDAGTAFPPFAVLSTFAV
ncbi:hypothetical protein D3C87_1273700 [compost metagenome]